MQTSHQRASNSIASEVKELGLGVYKRGQVGMSLTILKLALNVELMHWCTGKGRILAKERVAGWALARIDILQFIPIIIDLQDKDDAVSKRKTMSL